MLISVTLPALFSTRGRIKSEPYPERSESLMKFRALSPSRKNPVRPSVKLVTSTQSRGGGRASAALPLLDDVTTSPASRRLASARPALAPKCQVIFARALSAGIGAAQRSFSSRQIQRARARCHERHSGCRACLMRFLSGIPPDARQNKSRNQSDTPRKTVGHHPPAGSRFLMSRAVTPIDSPRRFYCSSSLALAMTRSWPTRLCEWVDLYRLSRCCFAGLDTLPPRR